MNFNPDLLFNKIKAIQDLQNNSGYKSSRAMQKAQADEKKAREQQIKKELKDRVALEIKAKKSAEKKAKDIMLARKIKRLENDSEAITIDYTVGAKSNSRAKPLPKRDLDLGNKIPVRIDHRTVVYAEPGADIETLRAKYKRDPFKFDDEKVPARKSSKPEPVADDNQIKKLLDLNLPVKQIAKMLNVKPSSVKKAAKYMGIKIK
jgi:hypothetical protein